MADIVRDSAARLRLGCSFTALDVAAAAVGSASGDFGGMPE
ncbi:hypothetical protein ACFVUW_11615 [Streptomyces xiamenensis]